MVSSVHDFITRNDESQVKHWLSNTADVDELDTQMRTPLFVAVQQGNIPIAKLILKKGCNVNICSNDGVFPLQLAIYNKNLKLAELLISHKADPNKQNPGGLNAIGILCSIGPSNAAQNKILQALLKSGGKFKVTNTQGETPLHIAARNGYNEFIQTLISHNASVDQVNRLV